VSGRTMMEKSWPNVEELRRTENSKRARKQQRRRGDITNPGQRLMIYGRTRA